MPIDVHNFIDFYPGFLFYVMLIPGFLFKAMLKSMNRWESVVRKPACCITMVLLVFIFFCAPARADEDRPTKSYTWKKGYLNIGYYLATLDSSFRIGDQDLGIGLDFDVESLLGLNKTDSSFRISGGYRFGQTRRHKLEFGWFRFHRNGSAFLDAEIEIPNLPDGSGGGSIGPGSFESVFNFDIIELT